MSFFIFGSKVLIVIFCKIQILFFFSSFIPKKFFPVLKKNFCLNFKTAR